MGFNDPLHPSVVARTFFRMMLIFFCSLIFFRIMFGRNREKIDPMDEYLYYQL